MLIMMVLVIAKEVSMMVLLVNKLVIMMLHVIAKEVILACPPNPQLIKKFHFCFNNN